MMKGNQEVGNNQKSFKDGANIQKGSDPMPRSSGHCETSPMPMNMKEFSKTKSTACGLEK